MLVSNSVISERKRNLDNIVEIKPLNINAERLYFMSSFTI